MNMNSQPSTTSYQNPTSTSASNWLNDAIGSIKNTASNAASAAKKATNSTMSSLSTLYPKSTSSYTTSTPINQMYGPSTQYDSRISGGMKRRKRGGYKSNISLNNIASTAAPINGIPTAKPQVWVGGKTKKKRCTKRHKHFKSCKSKKTKRRM